MKRAMGFCLATALSLGGCIEVLNVTVKGRVEQIFGEELTLFQGMQRSEPIPVEQRCAYWTARAAEATADLKMLIPVGRVRHSSRFQAIVLDARDRACDAPLPPTPAL